MNILPVFSNRITYNNIQNLPKNNNFGIKSHAPVSSCGISFGGPLTTYGDAFEHQLSKPSHIKRMKRLATIYLDIIESVATKLKDVGVFFNREYCEQNPIKSPKSCRSKVTRSGSLVIPDQIRATLFCPKLYDLSILSNYIIPEFRERGFVLAPREIPVEEAVKRGHIPTKQELEKGVVVSKDLDIRLESENLTNNSALSFYTSQPQKSGYEDIQMRFVRDYDESTNPVKHELIIIFGNNYAKAKHYESSMIYEHTRRLYELNFLKKIKHKQSKELINRYITLIKSLLNLGISKKIFDSAKNLDVYGFDDKVTINMSNKDISVIESCLSEIRLEARKYYDQAEYRAKTPKRKEQIKQERAKDSQLLTDIQKSILESIEYFNNKSLKILPDINSDIN